MKLEKIEWEVSPQVLPCTICGNKEPAEYFATVFLGGESPLQFKASLCVKCANLHEGTVVRLINEKHRGHRVTPDWD